ncbi:c-type cytochrome [Pseudomonas chlororaphis]|uniref:SorB family sulfite dehydrogenase c-type cytochrome subunit n=1 Tax=Pseudomonas chlororaphis TaxID=587753 RepID=UPI0030D1A912
MNCVFRPYGILFFALCSVAPYGLASPLTITLPAETIALRPSDLPGYVVAQQKCGVCHSADYIEYQPPAFNQKQWTGLARKMKESYGAQLSEHDVELIGEYLAATYSDDTAVEGRPTIRAIEAAPQTVELAAVDVKALLEKNACLGCHSIDRKIVGPAYHDVAMFYKGNTQAVSQVIEHISQGGVGRWGSIPMPPFPGLQQVELKQLAEFILAQ